MNDTWTEQLRDRGIQVTAQRLAVFRAVSQRAHVTAEDVIDVASLEIGAISRQSVYDSLTLLVERGLVRRIQPEGSPARYEDRVNDNHHHLICRECGRLVDVDCAVGEAPCLTASDDNGFEIDEAEVAYWGRCPECQMDDVDATAPRDVERATSPTTAASRVSLEEHPKSQKKE